MKVLLVGPDYEENLSIRYLSASLLAAGHDAILATFNTSADMADVATASEAADIVGLSMCSQSRNVEILELAQAIKSAHPTKLIVAGGHYASCAADPLLTNHTEIDLVVIHEGERTLVEIADAGAELPHRLPTIPGIAYRDAGRVRFTTPRPMLDDLDLLPCPDRTGPVRLIAGVPTAYLIGSRGCFGNCAYCCITTLHRMAPGKRFRQRQPEKIADEMAVLYHERGVRQFVFHDDNFLVPSESANHKRLDALEAAFKRRGIRDIAMVIKCRPADANKALLQRLREMGLLRVFFGIESANTVGLATLERRQTVQDSELALDACRELGISAQFTLLTFHPDATLNTIRSDIAFMRRYINNPINFCRAEIYAGTPLEKRMIEEGRASGDYLARSYNLSDTAADAACTAAIGTFLARCWHTGSLMQRTIGTDHVSATMGHFYEGQSVDSLRMRVAAWVRAANEDTIGLLEELIDVCAASNDPSDEGFRRALADIREREALTRRGLLAQGAALRAELDELCLRMVGFRKERLHKRLLPLEYSGVARHAAAVLLALGIAGTYGASYDFGAAEMAGGYWSRDPLMTPDQRPDLPRPVTMSAAKDHQRLMDLLRIKQIRPGAQRQGVPSEEKANPYGGIENLPDPLKFNDGAAVDTPEKWRNRRGEIVEVFDREIYGRIPKDFNPKITWEVIRPERNIMGGSGRPIFTKTISGSVDMSSYPLIPSINMQFVISTPAGARGPVPVILKFSSNISSGLGGLGGFSGNFSDQSWQAQCLAKGWGYGVIDTSTIQDENGDNLTRGVIGLSLKGQPRKLDDWGVLRAWAWGASRFMDYLETDKDVDAKQVGLEGHSLRGKAALVAMAYDERFAICYCSSSGEGGAKLNRRNYGELVENLAGVGGYQRIAVDFIPGGYHLMAGNFLKYAADPLKWSDIPVDQHELIALCAPRPCFISGGSADGDAWADPKGMFMAAAAAQPVFALLGKKTMGTNEFPKMGTPLIDGEIAFRQHEQGNTDEPNWPTFITFASRYLKAPPAKTPANPPPTAPDPTGSRPVLMGPGVTELAPRPLEPKKQK
jgi:radical SAM superfamily enzyme YgiQ (UPF0313 family)